jgi:integration host factor subunit alpha
MCKLDIAKRITGQAGITEREAVTLLDGILDLFKATLQKGEPISIPNFGVFTVRSKAPRPGRNPRTGEEIMIKARRVVIFHASSQFKREVNSVQAEPQDAEVLPPRG